MLILVVFFSKKVAKTEEMSIMLIMSIFLGTWGGGLFPLPPKVPKKINMINMSPVLAIFPKRRINMINISPVLSTFCPKKAKNRGNANHVNIFLLWGLTGRGGGGALCPRPPPKD